MQENSKEKLKIKGGEKNTAGLKRETGAEARENIRAGKRAGNRATTGKCGKHVSS